MEPIAELFDSFEVGRVRVRHSGERLRADGHGLNLHTVSLFIGQAPKDTIACTVKGSERVK